MAGGGPRVVASIATFHARVRVSVPGLGGLKETKMFLPHPRVKVSIVGSLRDREVACSASEIRILCLEDSVISFISPSSGVSPGPVQPICAQRWPKARFISFHLPQPWPSAEPALGLCILLCNMCKATASFFGINGYKICQLKQTITHNLAVAFCLKIIE